MTANEEENKAVVKEEPKKHKKVSEMTPAERAEYDRKQYEQLIKRSRRQLKEMQQMWIPMHRYSEDYIDSLEDKYLLELCKRHADLWIAYDNKPIKPDTCETCGVEVGKCEVVLVGSDGEMAYYNKECRQCYDERTK